MRLLKISAGLLLIPICLGFILGFLNEISSVSQVDLNEAAFAAGALVYILIYRYLLRPRILSLFEHELDHAFWAALFGAKVKAFHVSREGGLVWLTKTNFLINLAPYFFPLFTFLVVAISFFVDESYMLLVFFLIGFTLAFHMLSTVESLRVRQSDITKTGVVFSLPFIFIANLFVLILVMKFISPGNISIARFLETSFGYSEAIIELLWIEIKGRLQNIFLLSLVIRMGV
ncbi:MAG: M50 family metallopeptidase [Candidatus Hydrothermarchaeales archaeon]